MATSFECFLFGTCFFSIVKLKRLLSYTKQSFFFFFLFFFFLAVIGAKNSDREELLFLPSYTAIDDPRELNYCVIFRVDRSPVIDNHIYCSLLAEGVTPHEERVSVGVEVQRTRHQS